LALWIHAVGSFLWGWLIRADWLAQGWQIRAGGSILIQILRNDAGFVFNGGLTKINADESMGREHASRTTAALSASTQGAPNAA
jgi:hypothetical protein